MAATGQQCLPLAVDVRQPQTIVAAVDEALREFKRIDILVNGELPGLGRGRLAQNVPGRVFCTWAASAASALLLCSGSSWAVTVQGTEGMFPEHCAHRSPRAARCFLAPC